MLKLAPVMLPAMIETPAVPRFDSVIPIDVLAPTGKLPKLTLEGLALSAPSIPLPFRGMDSEPSVALELIVIVPELVPVAVGANVTEKFAVSPATMICPELIPLALKLEPVVLT